MCVGVGAVRVWGCLSGTRNGTSRLGCNVNDKLAARTPSRCPRRALVCDLQTTQYPPSTKLEI